MLTSGSCLTTVDVNYIEDKLDSQNSHVSANPMEGASGILKNTMLTSL